MKKKISMDDVPMEHLSHITKFTAGARIEDIKMYQSFDEFGNKTITFSPKENTMISVTLTNRP